MRTVASAITIDDLRSIARHRLPDFAFLPMEHGTGDGRGPDRSIKSFDRYSLVPRVPETLAPPVLTTTLFGREYAAPFGISAIGYAGKMRAGTDIALAEAAVETNVPFILSGASVVPLETIAKVAPGRVWQQLYVSRNEAITDDFLSRGNDCGVDVLVVTVDMPTPPLPDYVARSGIRLPVSVSARAWPHLIWQLATHPGWCLEHVRRGVPKLESWAPYAPPGSGSADLATFFHAQTLPGVSWREIEHIRNRWAGKLVIKGLLHAADVARARNAGADAATVSNHGGNKLETTITPLSALRRIGQSSAKPEGMPLLFDGGIRCGADLIIAKSLGADFSFIGRAALYGALAGGRAGAVKAIEILRGQVARTLQHLGCGAMDELCPDFVEDRHGDESQAQLADAVAAQARMMSAVNPLHHEPAVPPRSATVIKQR